MTSDEPTPPQDLRAGCVQRAMRDTTEFISHELAQPQAVAPESSESEWRIARAVVVMHGVSGLMATRTRRQGPAGWQGFLAEQRAEIAAAPAAIAGLLRQVDECARAAGRAAHRPQGCGAARARNLRTGRAADGRPRSAGLQS